MDPSTFSDITNGDLDAIVSSPVEDLLDASSGDSDDETNPNL